MQGDGLDWLHRPIAGIPDVPFALAWAAALVGAGVWAGRTDRRWVLNLVTVFAGIHFYTQWFERLGATPATVLLAGLAMLGFAVFLWRVNQRPGSRRHRLDGRDQAEARPGSRKTVAVGAPGRGSAAGPFVAAHPRSAWPGQERRITALVGVGPGHYEERANRAVPGGPPRREDR